MTIHLGPRLSTNDPANHLTEAAVAEALLRRSMNTTLCWSGTSRGADEDRKSNSSHRCGRAALAVWDGQCAFRPRVVVGAGTGHGRYDPFG